MAGRETDFGGRWLVPCKELGNNIIGCEVPSLTIHVCDDHFRQLNEAGKVTDPNVGTEEDFFRKYGHRP